MQDGVFGKIDQDAQAVALAAAEDDQIDRFFLRDAQDLGLLVAGFHPGGHARQPSASRQLFQFEFGALFQILFDLHRRHQRLTHGFGRHEFDHMQHHHCSVRVRGHVAARGHDLFAGVSQIQQYQDFLVVRHALLSITESDGRQAGRIARASRLPGRSCESIPQDSISSGVSNPFRPLLKILRRCENAAVTSMRSTPSSPMSKRG